MTNDETSKSLVTLLWEVQQKDALVDTQRRLLADKANCPAGHLLQATGQS